MALFRPDTSVYDVLIHLDGAAIPMRYAAVNTGTGRGPAVVRAPWLQTTGFKNMDDDASLLLGFDPVACYLADVEARYGHLGLFFHDSLGMC